MFIQNQSSLVHSHCHMTPSLSNFSATGTHTGEGHIGAPRRPMCVTADTMSAFMGTTAGRTILKAASDQTTAAGLAHQPGRFL